MSEPHESAVALLEALREFAQMADAFDAADCLFVDYKDARHKAAAALVTFAEVMLEQRKDGQ